MAWLCAHCLFDRKAKPRLADVLLRVFHHPSSGSTATPLNTTEAAVLLEALLTVPAPDNDEHDPGVSGQATALPKETAGTPLRRVPRTKAPSSHRVRAVARRYLPVVEPRSTRG
ncbi:hypothetical protein ACFQ2B_40135 [Streptomyces stramineus]